MIKYTINLNLWHLEDISPNLPKKIKYENHAGNSFWSFESFIFKLTKLTNWFERWKTSKLKEWDFYYSR